MPTLLPGGERIKGPHIRQFCEALLGAFAKLERLDEMLLFELSLERERIALGNNTETICASYY